MAAGVKRPARVTLHDFAAPFFIAGQDSSTASGGDVRLSAAATASVVLKSGASAAFSETGTVFAGDTVLGTGSGSSMTLGGATSESHAVDVQLLGQAASVGRGGSVLLSAGSSAAQGESGGSVLVDAGTDPAGGSPAEVQVATASVCPLTLMFAVFIFSGAILTWPYKRVCREISPWAVLLSHLPFLAVRTVPMKYLRRGLHP
jgi:hypothetical protein